MSLRTFSMGIVIGLAVELPIVANDLGSAGLNVLLSGWTALAAAGLALRAVRPGHRRQGTQRHMHHLAQAPGTLDTSSR